MDLGSGSPLSEPPRQHGGDVQSSTKSASTWLLNAWCSIKSNSYSANSTAHLVMLLVALGLWSTALSGYDDTTEIL
jgi:hypothetical protein